MTYNNEITSEMKNLANIIGHMRSNPKDTCLAETCSDCVLKGKCNINIRYAHFLMKQGISFTKNINL